MRTVWKYQIAYEQALEAVKAEAWEAGVNAEATAAVTASPRIPNPYRKDQDRG